MKKSNVVISESLGVIEPMVVRDDLFTPDPDLTPDQRFEDCLAKAKKLVAMDRSCANSAQWMIGSFLAAVQKAPEEYGRDGELCQAELAEKVGCSTGRICNGYKLFRAYTYEELKQFMGLPNEVLLTATHVAKPKRCELLEGFVDQYRDGLTKTAQMLEALSVAVERRQRITDASGIEGSPAAGLRELPIKPFRSAARRLIQTAQDLGRGLEGDEPDLLGDDQDEIEEIIASLKVEIAKLEEMVK